MSYDADEIIKCQKWNKIRLTVRMFIKVDRFWSIFVVVVARMYVPNVKRLLNRFWIWFWFNFCNNFLILILNAFRFENEFKKSSTTNSRCHLISYMCVYEKNESGKNWSKPIHSNDHIWSTFDVRMLTILFAIWQSNESLNFSIINQLLFKIFWRKIEWMWSSLCTSENCSDLFSIRFSRDYPKFRVFFASSRVSELRRLMHACAHVKEHVKLHSSA